jgi:3-oxoacyl-[acyl-carrier protein] reductase
MSNTFDLGGRCAIVTGGAQGIGRAIAESFLGSGAAVAIWDRDGRLAEDTAAAFKGYGRVAPFDVDVVDYRGVERARDATLEEFGHIDILVNNAGIGGPTQATWEYPLDAWRQVLAVNLDGAFHCCRAVVPHMVANNYGRIVNIASIAGKGGNPQASAYSASKAALIALTMSLGKELAAYLVSVNCITPSSADTALLRQFSPDFVAAMLAKVLRGRFVRVDEIASLAAFCASAECSFTTGTVFNISGGQATY